ncbi:MAG: hypothetical protein KDN22_05010 [Verrucomicrobiae bacterium]|nr:hypothetical protein [Verrucomicrobiae bacterium]
MNHNAQCMWALKSPFSPYLLAALAVLVCSFGLGKSLVAQTIYEEMKVRSPTPTVNNLTRLRYGGGKFLAVGENATILSSDDGTTWMSHDSGYDRSVSDIAFGNGVYVVAATDNRTVLTSFDLETWEVRRPGVVPFNCGGIIFQNGLFYLCGSEGKVVSSVDGVEWTEHTASADFTLRDILFAGGQFVTVGDNNTVLTSPDGATWTLRPTGVALDGLASGLLSVSYVNNQYLIGGKDGTILTSTDGISWTDHPYTETNAWFWRAMYKGGAYYLSGRQGTLVKTTDFSTWESVQIVERGDNDIYGMLEAEGRTVVVGRGPTILSSTDFANWTSHKGGYNASFSALAYGNGMFVLADYEGAIRTSSDSLVWTDVSTLPDGVYDMIYADGKFVATGYNSELIQSIDGVLWSAPVQQFTDGFPAVKAIRYANGRWFMLGRNGLLRSSTNLSNWTISDVDSSIEMNDLTFGNGTYVAVGGNGAIYSSIDGLQWDSRDSGGTTAPLNAVAFGDGRFVAGGNFGAVLTSLNGIDWSPDGVTFPPSSIFGLVYRDGQFIGFGPSGQIGFSADGKSWSSVRIGIQTYFSGFAEGNERIVGVGNGGLIMSSDPLPNQTLTLNISGSGMVSTDPAGRVFKRGTTITLTAVPDAGNAFFGWSGAASGNVNPITVTLSSDLEITATFQSALTGFALWQASEFTASERGNPALSGPLADPDEDGRWNLIEYLGGTLPKTADTASFVTASKAKLGLPEYPVLTYTRAKGRSDVTEHVEISNDLQLWNSNGDGSNQTYTTIFNVIDGPNNTEIVSVRGVAAIVPGATTCMRLRVTMP